MCGIYGYVGKRAIEKTMEGLTSLEYRGYDSAGIAFLLSENNFEKINKKSQKMLEKYRKNIKIGANKLFSVREKGEIKCLKNVLNDFSFSSTIAISHTRWATHGVVSIENAHPHLSQDGKWAVVHNGIIENYNELKGCVRSEWIESETDSEIVAHLLQVCFKGDALAALREVCAMLKGSYALAVVFADQKDKIFVARKNSPAIVGFGKRCGVVCSDAGSIKDCERAYVLDEENYAVVKQGSVEIYDSNLNRIEGKKIEIEQEQSTDKKTYPHYMLKEIEETPQVLQKTAEIFENRQKFSTILPPEEIRQFKKMLLIGCGTAYHAALMGAEMIERECKISCCCQIASEFLYKEFLHDKQTLAIFVSQSGETADTLKAVSLCKQQGLTTLAITNVKNSTIARECDFVFYTQAGKEVAVASTKAFSGQVALLGLFAFYIKSVLQEGDFVENAAQQLKKIGQQLAEQKIDSTCRQIAEEIKSSQSIYMVGRGIDYILALESSLKLKEISYIHSEAYPAGELKHGTISLIEEGTYVFAFASNQKTLPKTISNLKEVQSRGGRVILLSPFEIQDKFYKNISLFAGDDFFMSLFAAVYMQKIAYFTACALGNNPDKPRSLAKSVTVE